jgi:hypothetical protein
VLFQLISNGSTKITHPIDYKNPPTNGTHPTKSRIQMTGLKKTSKKSHDHSTISKTAAIMIAYQFYIRA